YEIAKCERKGIILMTGRGAGKSYWASCLVAHNYTFYKTSQSMVSAGEENDLITLVPKIRGGLDNLPREFQHRSFKSDWKSEVRSGAKSNLTQANIGFNSVIWIRNLKNNSMAANG